MTPAEKAEDIIIKFLGCQPVKTTGTTTVKLLPPDMGLAKKCAIICVEEILSDNEQRAKDADLYAGKESVLSACSDAKNYWNKVLEILKAK